LTSSNRTSRAPELPQLNGQSSARRSPRSPTSADQFELAGPSDPPDPATHAYRKDLADVALAGRVIASHYAEPAHRHLIAKAKLRSAPSGNGDVLCALSSGDTFEMLDDTLGWAWGYAGPKRRVGYVESDKISA